MGSVYLLNGDKLDSSKPLLPSCRNACSLRLVNCCWCRRFVKDIPASEMDVNPKSPGSPLFWEPLPLFIIAAMEKFVILESEDVGVFGWMLTVSVGLGIKMNGLIVGEVVGLGEVDEYEGEFAWSSWFCPIGNANTLGEIMQAYICIREFVTIQFQICNFSHIIFLCTVILHTFYKFVLQDETE